MKTISSIALLSLAIAAAPMAAPAQTADQTTHGFEVRGFDRIELSGCDVVTVALGSAYAVTARGRAANIANLRIDTNGSTLRIRRRSDSCNGHDRRVAIAVTLPALQAVNVSGAGEMTLPALATRAFAVTASGAGVVRLPALRGGSASFGLSGASQLSVGGLQVERASLDASGASVLRVAGAVRQLGIDGSGASDVDARGLSAPSVTIGASGTAKVHARSTEQAQIGASGMASVTVDGHPRCTVSKSGLARVTCA